MTSPLTNVSITYCGVGATQSWADLYLWEVLLNEHPTKAIIELGTAYGGLSIFLNQQAMTRGYKFHTFDSIDHRTDPVDQCFGRPSSRIKAADLGSAFEKIDILGNPDRIIEVISQYDHIVLACDNGDKRREVKMFGSTMKPGSICVVHDFGTEINDEDIPDYFEPRLKDLSISVGCISRAFIKR